MFRRLLVSAFVLAAATLGHPKPPVVNKAEAEWTLVFFMDSDTNLESAQNENLKALARGISSDKINVIALIDRSAKDNEDGFSGEGVGQLPNWHGGKLIRISHEKVVSLEDWGVVDTTNPDLLVKTFNKAVEIAPAKRYCLVLSDHGASWPGLNADESASDSMLSLQKLAVGLKQITDKHGRLELLHFDNCLMGCAETYTAVAPFAQYVTASEEVVPGLGTDYDGLLKAISAKPAVDGREFGKVLVQSFQDFYAKSSDDQLRDTAKTITMALIDCGQVDALTARIKEFISAQNDILKRAYRPEFLKIAKSRKESTEYGKGSGDEASTDTIDLVDYCTNLKKNFSSGPLVDKANAVIDQVGKTVVVSIRGSALPRSHGVSIYFPLDDKQLKGSDESYDKTQFDSMTQWGKSLMDLMTIKATDKQPPKLAPVVVSTDAIKKGAEATFTSKIDTEDLAEVYFTIAVRDEKDTLILGQIPTGPDERGSLTETWDGNWLYMHNGDDSMICPIDDVQLVDEENVDGEIVVLVPLQVQRKGKADWIDVTATFLLDFSEDAVVGDLVYIFDESGSGKREIDLRKGDKVRPVFLMVDEKGQEDYVPAEGPEFELDIQEADGLAIEEDRVPAGEYLMGFRAFDFAENFSEDFKKVKVED